MTLLKTEVNIIDIVMLERKQAARDGMEGGNQYVLLILKLVQKGRGLVLLLLDILFSLECCPEPSAPSA